MLKNYKRTVNLNSVFDFVSIFFSLSADWPVCFFLFPLKPNFFFGWSWTQDVLKHFPFVTSSVIYMRANTATMQSNVKFTSWGKASAI
jgi:hypothetical protein